MINRRRQFVPEQTNNKRRILVVVFVILVILCVLPITRATVRDIAGGAGVGVARTSHGIVGFFGGIVDAVRSKRALVVENTNLKAEVAAANAANVDRDVLAQENADLKVSLGRPDKKQFTLAVIMSKPPVSPYDTLVIDGGTSVGQFVGAMVYAYGLTPIGVVSVVRDHSSTVKLFSAPGVETDARLEPSHLDVTLVGRGGGNFSLSIPHDATIGPASTVVTRTIDTSVLAVYQKITSDARDPFQNVLLSSPVNIMQLSTVEVEQ